MDAWELITALCVGIGLAAAAGFRVFVPLLVLAIAGRTGHLALAGNLDWLASDPALIALGLAAALELGAYYIPWIDNALDTIATPAAGLAGTVAAASTLGAIDGMDPMLQWALGVIAGGGTALSVQGLSVGTRAFSSITTGGLGNPVVATGEATAATGLAVLAVLVPLVAAALVLAVLILLGQFVFRRWRRRSSARPVAP